MTKKKAVKKLNPLQEAKAMYEQYRAINERQAEQIAGLEKINSELRDERSSLREQINVANHESVLARHNLETFRRALLEYFMAISHNGTSSQIERIATIQGRVADHVTQAPTNTQDCDYRSLRRPGKHLDQG